MPIESTHFAWTTGETIVQLHGMGPWGITSVKQADDPRAKLRRLACDSQLTQKATP